MGHSSGLTNLQRLDLSELGVSHVEPLGSLTRVEYSNLSGNSITDAGLQHLARMANLQELHLRGPQVTDEGLARLQKALSNARFSTNVLR